MIGILRNKVVCFLIIFCALSRIEATHSRFTSRDQNINEASDLKPRRSSKSGFLSMIMPTLRKTRLYHLLKLNKNKRPNKPPTILLTNDERIISNQGGELIYDNYDYKEDEIVDYPNMKSDMRHNNYLKEHPNLAPIFIQSTPIPYKSITDREREYIQNEEKGQSRRKNQEPKVSILDANKNHIPEQLRIKEKVDRFKISHDTEMRMQQNQKKTADAKMTDLISKMQQNIHSQSHKLNSLRGKINNFESHLPNEKRVSNPTVKSVSDKNIASSRTYLRNGNGKNGKSYRYKPPMNRQPYRYRMSKVKKPENILSPNSNRKTNTNSIRQHRHFLNFKNIEQELDEAEQYMTVYNISSSENSPQKDNKLSFQVNSIFNIEIPPSSTAEKDKEYAKKNDNEMKSKGYGHKMTNINKDTMPSTNYTAPAKDQMSTYSNFNEPTRETYPSFSDGIPKMYLENSKPKYYSPPSTTYNAVMEKEAKPKYADPSAVPLNTSYMTPRPPSSSYFSVGGGNQQKTSYYGPSGTSSYVPSNMKPPPMVTFKPDFQKPDLSYNVPPSTYSRPFLPLNPRGPNGENNSKEMIDSSSILRLAHEFAYELAATDQLRNHKKLRAAIDHHIRLHPTDKATLVNHFLVPQNEASKKQVTSHSQQTYQINDLRHKITPYPLRKYNKGRRKIKYNKNNPRPSHINFHKERVVDGDREDSFHSFGDRFKKEYVLSPDIYEPTSRNDIVAKHPKPIFILPKPFLFQEPFPTNLDSINERTLAKFKYNTIINAIPQVYLDKPFLSRILSPYDLRYGVPFWKVNNNKQRKGQFRYQSFKRRYHEIHSENKRRQNRNRSKHLLNKSKMLEGLKDKNRKSRFYPNLKRTNENKTPFSLPLIQSNNETITDLSHLPLLDTSKFMAPVQKYRNKIAQRAKLSFGNTTSANHLSHLNATEFTTSPGIFNQPQLPTDTNGILETENVFQVSQTC